MRRPLVVAKGRAGVWVHWTCALYSPQSFHDFENWYNVTKEVSRGRRLSCTVCGLKGATIGCIEDGCKVNVHLPCAIKVKHGGLLDYL